jgi:hypothetical protein
VILKKMAADSEECGQELQERNDSTTNSAEMQRLLEEICKQTLDDWRDSAAEYVRAELFDKNQFITDEEIGMVVPYKNWCAPTSILVARKEPEVSGRNKEERKLLEKRFQEKGKLLRMP